MTNAFENSRIRVTKLPTERGYGYSMIDIGDEGIIVRAEPQKDEMLYAVKLDRGSEWWLAYDCFEVINLTVGPSVPLPLAGGAVFGKGSYMTLAELKPSTTIHFGPNISIDYGVDPPKVELRGAEPDDAAKAFWNAVAAVTGGRPIFPEVSHPPGLLPFNHRTSRPGELYVDDKGERWKVIGWIAEPAAILHSLTDDREHVEVIGCRNAERFRYVGRTEE